MYRGGMGFMRRSISDTAEYGDYTRGPKIVTDEVRAAMRRMLADIQSGSFAREWIAESRSGARLRAMMPWTEEGKAGQGARGSGRRTEPEQRAQRPEPLRA